jgi:hypothetical protein
MATSSYNIDIFQGSTYSTRITARDENSNYINLSGYSSRAYVKCNYGATGTVAQFSCLVHPSYVSGIIDISLTAAQTATLPVTQAVYDLEIFNTGETDVTKLLRGYVNIYPETTI